MTVKSLLLLDSDQNVNNNMISITLRTLVVIGLFTLCGCSIKSVTNSNFSDKAILLDQVNLKAKPDPSWFDKSQEEKKKLEAGYTGELSPDIAIYLESNTYLYNDKDVANYITTIVDRLLNSWKGTKPELTVLIETGETMNAYVDELNLLHVSTGLLRKVGNEDQLASVLAHELSHLLLRHVSEKSFAERVETTLDMSGMIMAAGGDYVDQITKKNNYHKKGLDGQFGFQSLGLVWGDMLIPQWSRDNEIEADKMGLDLLIRANYNYEEFPLVLEQISDANGIRSERIEMFRVFTYDLIEKNQEKISTSASSELNKKLERWRSGLEKYMVENITNVLASMNKSHDDSGERIDSLKTYLNLVYAGGDLPPEISTNKFSAIVRSSTSTSRLKQDMVAIEIINALSVNNTKLASDISKKSHLNSPTAPTSVAIAKSTTNISVRKYKDAAKNLTQLLSNRNSPVEAYIKLAELYLADRKYPQAENVIHLGIKRIGRDYAFLPTLVKINKDSGNITAAEENTIRCKRYDDNQSSLSEMVFGDDGENSSHYQQCVNALGYDAIAQRQQKTKSNLPSGAGDYPKILNIFR